MTQPLDLTAPGSYKVTGDLGPVMLPFEFLGLKLLIHATMNGKQVKLLIDNGRLWDAVWFYNGEDASINLHYSNSNEVIQAVGVGEGSGTLLYEGEPVEIDFGPIQFFDQPTLISPPEAGWGNFFPGVDGQVSSLLFKDFVVAFDFDKQEIVLTRPEDFQPVQSAYALPMRKGENGASYIPIAIEMKDTTQTSLELDIDLGGIYSLYLFEDEASNVKRPQSAEKELLGYGASGAINGYSGKVARVSLGGYKIENVAAVYVEKNSNTETDIVRNGTIGLPLLKLFKVTFDYFRGKLYLEKSAGFDQFTGAQNPPAQ